MYLHVHRSLEDVQDLLDEVDEQNQTANDIGVAMATPPAGVTLDVDEVCLQFDQLQITRFSHEE